MVWPNEASTQVEDQLAAELSIAKPLPVDPPSVPATIVIPKLTIVDIEILDPLNSKTSKMEDTFAIRLAKPIVVNDKTIVPAGVMGQGEVIHAAKARAAGKAGEIILTARYLDYKGQRIKLRSFRYGPSTGKSNADEAAAAGILIAAPLTLIISGRNIDIPVGTFAHAKTATEVKIITRGD